MAARSRQRWNWPAWGFLVLGLLVAGCLLTFDPAAPTPSTVHPLPPPAGNLFGSPGAWLAEQFYATLGNTVYLLLASWFVLVVLLLLRRGLRRWLLRLLGWVILLPVSAILFDLLELPAPRAARAGAGGSLGAWLAVWLENQWSEAGLIAFLTVALLAGTFLAFDFLFGGGLRWLRWYLKTRSQRAAPRQRPGNVVIAPDAPVEPTKPAIVDSPAAEAPSAPVRPPEDGNSEEEDESEHDYTEKNEGHRAAAPEIPAPALVPIVRPAPVQAETLPRDYELPDLDLLDEPEPFPYEQHDQELRERALQLEKIFRDFEINVRVVGINTGPVVTQFEIALETGLRVQKVTRLADDIALNMRVASVRMVAPIPGKNTVGVEIPNEHRAVVRLKEVILTAGKKLARQKIPLFLGKDTEGQPLVQDLADMPHLLIAGRTGTGKSVCLNAIILSILMTRRPDEVKMIMIDPKRTEMSEYGKVPHLMHPVVTDPKKAEAILAWAVDKMEERYDLLSRARVRNLAAYNALGYDEILKRLKPEEDERDSIPRHMPYIVIFVDEMADLVLQMKREIEGHIIRLAQKSRAAGIHLVVATQKPTVDVITGLIKSNLPARICFQVSSRSDSRVVLDEMGAEKLLGRGDMLFLLPGTNILQRAQGTYATDEEITRVVESLECEPEFSQELMRLRPDGGAGTSNSFLDSLRARDELYEQAIEIVVREGRGSVSLLQRALGIGYGRAARLIDFMAEDGIVGPYKGSSAREVLCSPEEWEEMKVKG